MNTKVKLANYYLPIFLFILSSGSAVGNVYPNFIYPLYFFCVLLCMILYPNSIRFKFNNIIIAVVFTAIYLLNYWYFQCDSPSLNSYVGNLLLLYGTFFLSAQMSFEVFKMKFSTLMFLIAIYSLIMYVLGLTIHLEQYATVQNSMPILGIYNYKDIVMARSSGIFWEPGVYQIFLNLAVLFIIDVDHFKFTPKNTLQLAILAVSILTTRSTTGYVTFTCLIIYFIFRFFSSRKLAIKLLLIAPLVAALGGLVVMIVYSPTVYNKLFVANPSTSIRLNDLTQSPQIIMESPLLGFGSGTYTEQYQNAIHGTIYSSVGIFLSAIRYGCIYMFLYICRIAVFIRTEFGKVKLLAAFLIVVFSFTEGMFEFALMFMFLFLFQSEPKSGMEKNVIPTEVGWSIGNHSE